jgi:trigger factor
MNITRNHVDALNAVVTVQIDKADYSDRVAKVLADYRKNANIPGFRKGAVPMSLVQKQYGKAIVLDEVNKLLQESLNQYITDEKLDILGNPLPKVGEDFNWDTDDFTFDFELGMAPAFTINFDKKNTVTRYQIVADNEMLDEQVDRIRSMYGKRSNTDEVAEGNEITGLFTNEEKGINETATFTLDVFADKKTAKKFIGLKAGDSLTLNTKGLFDDDHKLMDYLKVSHDEVHGLDIDVTFKIDNVTAIELANLDQDLFDRLFPGGTVTSVDEMKAKLKADAENQLAPQAESKFYNDITEHLIANTAFDLPAEFLKKWLQTAGDQPLTAEEAAEEFERSEKGLRYQLIESKLINENNLQLTFDELKDHAAVLIKGQMAQFGQLDPEDEDVQRIVMRVLSNQEETKRLSEQVMQQKMIQFLIEKSEAPLKEVNYKEFVKVYYGDN